MASGNLYTVPLHQPFAETVIRYALNLRAGEPEALARALILVPTRRAARALREEALRTAGGDMVLLPRIRPIGDVEEEELLFDLAQDPQLLEQFINLPPAMPETLRRLQMAKLLVEEPARP